MVIKNLDMRHNVINLKDRHRSYIMKKFIKRIPTILQILLFASAFAVNYFTETRMGMMRHVMFTNNKWESNFHAILIKNLSVITLGIALLVAILCLVYRRRSYIYDMHTKLFIGISMIMIAGTILFMSVLSTDTVLSYYFVSIIFCIISLIQVVKLHVFLHRNKKHKFIFR